MKGDPLDTFLKICEKKLSQSRKNLYKKLLVKVGLEPTSFCLADLKKAVTSMPSASRSYKCGNYWIMKIVKSGPFRVRLSAENETRRERPKSAPYLRLKNIQGTTIGNIWKKKFFKKIIFEFFFEKSFLSRTMPKNSKRGHSGSFDVFYKPKTSKKCKGVPFNKIRKFSKKVA